MSHGDGKSRYVLVGGGTGGHITPLLAVADELKRLRPDSEIIHIAERGGKFGHLTEGHDSIDKVKRIFSGKFRRYYGQSWLTSLTDIKTNLLNLRDGFYAFIGLFESIVFLWRTKPEAIFIKGGFVGVPVGLAAWLLKVPFLTHDSDMVPGLTNRIIGRWATLHATGMPAEFYNYPPEKTNYVGIPLSRRFQPVGDSLKANYRRKLSIPHDAKVVMVTGGSQGARRLNELVVPMLEQMLRADPKLFVLHQTGPLIDKLYGSEIMETGRIIVAEFFNDLHVYSGAADVVVSRAGATTIAELAVQGKACVIIPHPHLTGAHQLKNAAVLKQADAAEVFDEYALVDDIEPLKLALTDLLKNPAKRKELATNISKLAIKDSAARIAKLITKLR